MTATKRITVRLPTNLNYKLDNKANELGVSKNALVLNFLWDAIGQENTTRDLTPKSVKG